MYYEGANLTREVFFDKLSNGADVNTSQSAPTDISVTQRQSVCDALNMAKKGMSSHEIIDVLMEEKLEASIYITVDTLKHLKKGGRITPAAAAFGELFAIKTVLTIQGDKLDAFAKVRGIKSAKKAMLSAIENDVNTRFKDKEIILMAAYSCPEDDAEIWKEQIMDHFPKLRVEMNPLPLSICCHTGAGAVAVGCAKKLKI